MKTLLIETLFLITSKIKISIQGLYIWKMIQQQIIMMKIYSMKMNLIILDEFSKVLKDQ